MSFSNEQQGVGGEAVKSAEVLLHEAIDRAEELEASKLEKLNALNVNSPAECVEAFYQVMSRLDAAEADLCQDLADQIGIGYQEDQLVHYTKPGRKARKRRIKKGV